MMEYFILSLYESGDIMIKIVDNRGWQMTFPNGWTVSVVMGRGAYCANRDDEELEFTDSKPSPNAEIAAWDSTGKVSARAMSSGINLLMIQYWGGKNHWKY